MKIRSIIATALVLLTGLVSFTGCQKGDLVNNPNVANAGSLTPLPLLLNHLTATLIKSSEFPFADANKYDQYDIANYAYYRGTNNYSTGFTNTIDSYDIFKYALALQKQSITQLNSKTNVYYAIGQFFEAYAGIWLTQRVGDIPFSSVNGSTTNLTPKYDTQHDVYKECLLLLDSANNTINSLYSSPNPTYKLTPSALLSSTGDIFGLTNQQWQKVINTYRLRVLISLSKRAADNADLSVIPQFATIINNPAQYPIMTGNADNLVYKFNTASNPYSLFTLGFNPYNNFANVGSTYLNITTATKDPRTFVVASPAPAQITAGKSLSDFTAYVGADPDLAQSDLLARASAGPDNTNNAYSFSNFNRYYVDKSGATQEPFVFIGYPEMCFGIAEAINRGWISGASATWYTNGINASLALYGITDSKALTINYPVKVGTNAQGNVWGTVTADVATFLTTVKYKGDNADGLAQILTQKYVALNNNSGWEAYYNYRRTGVPAFAQGGVGIGTPNNLIPRRFLYPQNEITYNAANNQAAVSSQFGGIDDISKDTWLTK
ncbi:SusD/RagB family nutrient-binding outer membrane lipoprotein [Mucilaginibacter lappiensis]|uniref:Uncharacterized protein n=1 Tax=Mucilaginibacter lappiensis TaxID=354630 RepID=A0A1N6PL89_9SPHI|nr:SusD/RagB family nutrient-binding outer membrane lipoprotein [Mucilaginibacter lappiensis]MBB6107538.1 hypothetical protein [Mucilaginibacter lappiensis]MBB6126142.1 hypothetical protein [Mucilaginibacter lappiensis]SIQ05148.1 Starch-binding associating with outer membrane [Mucilaginibacter lappiensis]